MTAATSLMPDLFFTGGDASWLALHFAPQARVEHDLVLRGIAWNLATPPDALRRPRVTRRPLSKRTARRPHQTRRLRR